MFPRLLIVLASLLLWACSGLPVVAPAPLEDTVDLRFHWAPGSSATVDAMRTTVDISPRGHYQDQVRMRYRWEALEAGEGLRLVQRDLAVDVLPERWIPRTMEMVVMEIGQADVFVNGLGGFLGVGEPAAAQARVASWVGKIVREKTAPSGLQTRLVELFSEEAIEERSAGFWDELVGFWSGGTMELGRSYLVRDKIAVEGLGGIPVEMEVDVSFAGWVSCSPEEKALSCVKLELSAQPAPEQRPVLMKFTSALFPSDPEEEVRIEHRMELVTEPKGLRPRRMRASRLVSIPLLGGDAIVISDERDLIFRWSD